MTNSFIEEEIRDRIMALDPISFIEKHLTIDGKPFRLTASGYRPYNEIYRYIAVKALEKNGKKVVILKSRQTGMTTMAGALCMYFMGCGLFGNGKNPPIRIMHAFPQLDLAFSYSKAKLSSMISSSNPVGDSKDKISGKSKPYMQSLLDNTSSSADSLQFKQFSGGNHIWIESAGIDAQRLRGRTCDVLFMDEIQDIGRDAIANGSKILIKSQYGRPGEGVQVYFGTPKQRGSEFWKLWNMSSQQYYHLGCAKCKEYFPLYTPNSNEWENIWIYGFTVRCTHCGFEQNKNEAAERGKWIASKDQSECDIIGFHINQLYMPDFSVEQILNEKPGKSATNTERSYQNEVLGEFFQGEATVITPEQIRDKCGDPERRFSASIPSEDNALVFLGIDIGAKADLEQLADSNRSKSQGQSYSTAVVLAVYGPNHMSIQFATKFKRNDLASKKGIIDQLMRNYNCNLGVCDIGYAQDLNEIMQTEYGERFLSSEVAGRVNNHIKYDGDVFPKKVVFEKDFWISEMYEQMKKGNIRFPLGNYEQIAWLIQHCTSMEIKPTETRAGDFKVHYVKGSTPNDGFMALLNAYIAYKFYVSNGFKNNPGNNDFKKDDRPPVLSAYLPNMK